MEVWLPSLYLLPSSVDWSVDVSFGETTVAAASPGTVPVYVVVPGA
jgi:hypothetical protein